MHESKPAPQQTLRIGARKEKACFNYSHAAYTAARGTARVPHFDFVYLYGYLNGYYNLQIVYGKFTEIFNIERFQISRDFWHNLRDFLLVSDPSIGRPLYT